VSVPRNEKTTHLSGLCNRATQLNPFNVGYYAPVAYTAACCAQKQVQVMFLFQRKGSGDSLGVLCAAEVKQTNTGLSATNVQQTLDIYKC